MGSTGSLDKLHPMRLGRFLLVALFFISPAAWAKGKEAPVRRLDRTKVVGAPVLDEKAKPGVYVWVEDGWFQVAAVPKKGARKTRVKVRVDATSKIAKVRGDFSVRRARSGLLMTAAVGSVPVKGRFETSGDVTISADERIFVGPLAKRAAKSVTIGRY